MDYDFIGAENGWRQAQRLEAGLPERLTRIFLRKGEHT
jgi:hypothetical protein